MIGSENWVSSTFVNNWGSNHYKEGEFCGGFKMKMAKCSKNAIFLFIYDSCCINLCHKTKISRKKIYLWRKKIHSQNIKNFSILYSHCTNTGHPDKSLMILKSMLSPCIINHICYSYEGDNRGQTHFQGASWLLSCLIQVVSKILSTSEHHCSS